MQSSGNIIQDYPIRPDKRYNILSLDGGGARGLMTLQMLATLEQKLANATGNQGYKITQAFDMVIGTSAGGLIALALGCGFSARELAREKMNYLIEATFQKSATDVDNMVDAKYNASNLENAL